MPRTMLWLFLILLGGIAAQAQQPVPVPVAPEAVPDEVMPPGPEAAPVPVNASYPFSTAEFSAVFNGPVKQVTGDAGATKVYSSVSGQIAEEVAVHTASQDVPVSTSTTDRNADAYIANTGTLVGSKKTGRLQNHPFTAFVVHDTKNDQSHRVCFVALGPRTILRVDEIAPWNVHDGDAWQRFFSSLKTR